MTLVFKYSKEAQGHHFTEDIPCNKLMRMPSAFLKCIYPVAVQHGEDKNTLLQTQEGSFCTQGQAAREIKSALLKRRSSSPIKELCLFLTNLLPTYGFQEGVPVHPTHRWPRQTDRQTSWPAAMLLHSSESARLHTGTSRSSISLLKYILVWSYFPSSSYFKHLVWHEDHWK